MNSPVSILLSVECKVQGAEGKTAGFSTLYTLHSAHHFERLSLTVKSHFNNISRRSKCRGSSVVEQLIRNQ